MVEYGPEAAAEPRWLPARFEACPETGLVFALVGIALAIRLYLSLTSFCISGDGVAYLGMAHRFAAGDPAAAMKSVFSPLYPCLIAIVHYVIPGWELAGELVSVITGSAAVAIIYYLMREVFERRDVAFGAAALAAIHPELAAYSASVRTEAGFILLITTTVLLMIRGLKRRRAALIIAAGACGGFAYLYRTEGIGLLLVCSVFIPAGALLWRRWNFTWSLGATLGFAVAFVAVASPYLLFLRVSTGHWNIGREFTAAMMYGMGEVAPHRQAWRQLGFSTSASPIATIIANPRLYIEKVAGDVGASFYGFLQALGPVLTALMLLGLWWRKRLFTRFAETFLLILVLFYFCGFALTYTGTRFMVHFIAFTFGWVIVGLAALTQSARRLAAAMRWRLPPITVALVIALILLPRTLWPIGYDLRGFRYAAREIARRGGKPRAIVARDGRVAYYAGMKLIALPARPVNLCGWLDERENADYLLIGNRDERKFGIQRAAHCLVFVKRYPRYGTGYYDLFAIRSSTSGVSRADIK
ncbi:MAG: glycosyltransferase family 39 protein [Candidatus Binataceae bacterium]